MIGEYIKYDDLAFKRGLASVAASSDRFLVNCKDKGYIVHNDSSGNFVNDPINGWFIHDQPNCNRNAAPWIYLETTADNIKELEEMENSIDCTYQLSADPYILAKCKFEFLKEDTSVNMIVITFDM